MGTSSAFHKHFEGGCLCGAVRFACTGTPAHVSYCHCSMCRKATGGPYSVMASFPRAEIRWLREPQWRRSSPLAMRAFCSACGTPLAFQYDDSNLQSLSVGAFDDASTLVPEQHGGVESRLSWVSVDDHLPEERCDDDPDYRQLLIDTGWRPPHAT